MCQSQRSHRLGAGPATMGGRHNSYMFVLKVTLFNKSICQLQVKAVRSPKANLIRQQRAEKFCFSGYSTEKLGDGLSALVCYGGRAMEVRFAS